MDQERSDFLAAKVAASKKKGLLSAWPRTEKELTLVDLEVDWVRFSTLNHRIRAEQRREISTSGNADLFTADPLGPIAQAAEDKILRGQANFDQLRGDLDDRGQQENAIVTAEGVLINGNRRACALRSLLHDDNKLSCRYVRCLVLPSDATTSELLELETELQEAQTFKQDYSWVNHGLLIEDLYESYGRNFKRVAKMMHRNEKDIQADYEKLQQVNQLVALSQGKWLHVDFEPNESAFDELARYIRNKNEADKEAVRSVYFLGTIAGVNYRDLRHLRRADAEKFVTDELRGDEQLSEIVKLAETEANTDDPEDDVLDGALGVAGEVSLVRTVLQFVSGLDSGAPVELSSGSKVEVADVQALIGRAVGKAAEEAEEQKKDINTVQAPITRLVKALMELTRAGDALAKARAAAGWDEALFTAKLAEIESGVAKLKDTS